MTKDLFLQMPDDQCFDMCFPGLVSGEVDAETAKFSIDHMPYRLTFKDISGYYDNCHYCGESRCNDCMVPYD